MLDLPPGVAPPTPTGVLPHPPLSERSPDTISGSVGESIALSYGSGRRRTWAALIALAVVLFGSAAVLSLVKMRHPVAALPLQASANVDVSPSPSPAPSAATSPPATAVKPTKVEAPATQQVVVRSHPSGASVTVGDKVVGTTPALLQLALPQSLAITLRGYRPTHEVVTRGGEMTIQLVPEPVARHTTTRKKSGKDGTPTSLGLD